MVLSLEFPLKFALILPLVLVESFAEIRKLPAGEEMNPERLIATA